LPTKNCSLLNVEAAAIGSLFMGFAFGFLTEGKDSKMFFFFYGIGMSLFHEYNIQLTIKENDKTNS